VAHMLTYCEPHVSRHPPPDFEWAKLSQIILLFSMRVHTVPMGCVKRLTMLTTGTTAMPDGR